MTKTQLWAVGKSLLLEQGMAKGQCGTFVGKLVKDYGDAVVIDVLQAAVVERPADVASWLLAACKARARPRKPSAIAGDELLAESAQKAARIAARRAAVASNQVQEVIDV
jgi:hypothetical protein